MKISYCCITLQMDVLKLATEKQWYDIIRIKNSYVSKLEKNSSTKGANWKS